MKPAEPPKLCPISQFDSVKAAMMSPDLTVNHPFRATRMVLGPTILDLEGPRHLSARNVLLRFFARASAEDAQEELIAPVVRRNWEAMVAAGGGDVVADFAMRVPPEVVFRALGLPEADAAEIYRRDIGPIAGFIADNRTGHAEARAASERLSVYIDGRPAPDDSSRDGIGEIIGSYLDAGLELSEVMADITLLLAAGTETTVCAIANMFFLIGEYPETWNGVLSGDIPVKAFVEEVVRFEAPLQRTFRFARRTTEIEPGTVIPRFSAVELALCSANRNQPTLDQPENWAPAEGRGVGATFGFGRHVCLGKALALAELREVAALLRETNFQASSIRERSPLGTSTFRRPAAVRLALGPDSG